MKIKIRLREILAERGMSQRQLARQMDLRPSTINHLCSDNVDRVYIRTLENICEALNISIHELIDDEQESSNS
ncbi:helix-turn-helix transcriptional regulator [Paenibacillus sp. MZ04-78.2]|uniref:helix-turn-helix domain-containing protein n=2 Tax=Paenibacillus TaxID=44249 RepID=UPI0020B67E59|nr:helix-turn-helix transcriptional regulator [Paenibacillus sp. MZ04-78.2]MCP3775492.1 helix-turn-helix transcriptional regulator [Paenibacillus sp. MZ04-78.2]